MTDEISGNTVRSKLWQNF